MAALALRNAYQRLGFSQQTATALRDQQGISTLDESMELSDEECVNACRTIRRLGGGNNSRRGYQYNTRKRQGIEGS